jgi:molybdenum storage protein
MKHSLPSPYEHSTLSERDLRTLVPTEPIRIRPDISLVKVGGQSILDRGKPAVYPLIDEIVACKERHKMILTVGGGTRARHCYSIALELDLPTGVLAALGASTPRQNAWMMQMLMAKHDAIFMVYEDIEKLPLYLRMGCLPIMTGMPPFDWWEKLPAKGKGRIPPHRTDAGTFLTAEFLGARGVIFVKDEDGLFTADPKKDKSARHIPSATVREVLEMDLGDLIVERVVLEYLGRARNIKQIQIVNGLKPGNLTRALDGEPVGTIIRAD